MQRTKLDLRSKVVTYHLDRDQLKTVTKLVPVCAFGLWSTDQRWHEYKMIKISNFIYYQGYSQFAIVSKFWERLMLLHSINILIVLVATQNTHFVCTKRGSPAQQIRYVLYLLVCLSMIFIIFYMWCEFWSRSNSVFIFPTNCMHQFHSYILQKTPLKLVNCSKDMSSWRMPKAIGNKRYFLLCLALSYNQYFRLPTDFAWSHHIWWIKSCPIWHYMNFKKQHSTSLSKYL